MKSSSPFFHLITFHPAPICVSWIRFCITVEREWYVKTPFHKSCFKCMICNSGIARKNMIIHNGKPYCQHPCYNELFGLRAMSRHSSYHGPPSDSTVEIMDEVIGELKSRQDEAVRNAVRSGESNGGSSSHTARMYRERTMPHVRSTCPLRDHPHLSTCHPDYCAYHCTAAQEPKVIYVECPHNDEEGSGHGSYGSVYEDHSLGSGHNGSWSSGSGLYGSGSNGSGSSGSGSYGSGSNGSGSYGSGSYGSGSNDYGSQSSATSAASGSVSRGYHDSSYAGGVDSNPGVTPSQLGLNWRRRAARYPKRRDGALQVLVRPVHQRRRNPQRPSASRAHRRQRRRKNRKH